MAAGLYRVRPRLRHPDPDARRAVDRQRAGRGARRGSHGARRAATARVTPSSLRTRLQSVPRFSNRSVRLGAPPPKPANRRHPRPLRRISGTSDAGLGPRAHRRRLFRRSLPSAQAFAPTPGSTERLTARSATREGCHLRRGARPPSRRARSRRPSRPGRSAPAPGNPRSSGQRLRVRPRSECASGAARSLPIRQRRRRRANEEDSHDHQEDPVTDVIEANEAARRRLRGRGGQGSATAESASGSHVLVAVLACPCVREQEPCDVDGKEATPMQRGRDCSEQHNPQDDRHRLHAVVEVACDPQPEEQDQPARDTGGRTDRQLLDEAPHRVSIRAVRGSDGCRDGDHQRDPSRVVEARLTFEHRARPLGAAPPAQHGIDRRWVSRSEGDRDQQRDRPVETKHVVGGERESSRGGQVPKRPSARIGRAAARADAKPVPRPPWKRITDSATAPICSNVTIGDSPVGATPSEPAAIPTARNAAGLGNRSARRTEQQQAPSKAKRRRERAAERSRRIRAWLGVADQTSRHTTCKAIRGRAPTHTYDPRQP